MNTLDNILRLAKNDSALSKIDVKNIPLKRLMDGLLSQFERPNQAFPVSVRFLQDDGLIEAASVALDVNVIEWSVESLLLNAKKYAFISQGAVVSVAVLNSADLAISVSDFGSGIDPAERISIFKRYSRGKNSDEAPGIGIGLAVVSELLKLTNASNESVNDSSFGSGACFRITHPDVVSKV